MTAIYWTLERVVNGLRRFARDYYAGREHELPPRAHNYRRAIPPEEARMARRLRLYPEYVQVLRYFPDFISAWAEIGFRVEPTSLKYWTRERVIEGMRRFVEDFGEIPTDQGKYYRLAAFAPKYDKAGRPDEKGAYGKYPSWATASNYFPTMRSAWEAAGFDVDRGFEAWSEIEDWWILESVGIIPRTEAAAYIRRTDAAVKRRLYDLGRINSKNRWGITVNAIATQTRVGGSIVMRYLECGVIPYFRGVKSIYVNPADLPKIAEFDWSTLSPESGLYKLVRLALIQRALKILAYGPTWRDREIYKFQPIRERRQVRRLDVKSAVKSGQIPPPPNDLDVGDWIKSTMRLHMVEAGRLGVIKGVFYSAPRFPRADGTIRPTWMANVEFPKLKRLREGEANRVRYNLPLDRLERAEAPVVEIELKQTREAIRARERRSKYVHRASDRFNAIRQEIS